MTVSVDKTSFSGGIWGPGLHSRYDLPRYNDAVKRMVNFIPSPQGGTSNRGGQYYISSVPASPLNTRIIPFQFSVTQGYILVFGDAYMHVYADGQEVVTLVASPYAEEDLFELKYTQNADVMVLTHPSYAPHEVLRAAHASWSIVPITFGPSVLPPTGLTGGAGTNVYAVTSVSATGEESRTTSTVTGTPGTTTLTWTGATGAVRYNIYEVRNGVYGYLGTAIGLSYAILTTVSPDLTDTPPQAYNPFSSTDNYPGVALFHEQRLVLARTNNQPQTFFGSRVGNYKNMDVSQLIKADDSYEFTISSNQVNEIRWLLGLGDLVLGTQGGEWRASGGEGGAINPLNIFVSQQSQWGSSQVRPIAAGNNILFLESGSQILREITYSFEASGYSGRNLSVLVSHLLEGHTIVDWCYQKNPGSVLWLVRSDGKILGVTYYKEHDIVAWHVREAAENGRYRNVACIADGTGVDQVYCIVTPGEAGGRVEIFGDRLPQNELGVSDKYKSFFLDSALSFEDSHRVNTYSGPDTLLRLEVPGHGINPATPWTTRVRLDEVKIATQFNGEVFLANALDADTVTLYNLDQSAPDASLIQAFRDAYIDGVSQGKIYKMFDTVSGLGHLSGSNIAVVADGDVEYKGPLGVGVTTYNLSAEASVVYVGQAYISLIETLDFLYAGETGNVKDKIRSIGSAKFNVKDTKILEVGQTEEDMQEVLFRTDEPYGESTDLYSGEKEVLFYGGEGTSSSLVIRASEPLPVTVQSVSARVENGTY